MNISNFIALLFEFQINAHLIHFDPKSYAKHIALNELYSGLDELADRLAESYTGKYGVIENYPPSLITRAAMSPLELIDYYAPKIEEAREEFLDGWVQQIIDEILELVYTTKYKIQQLP